jgi:hypothetical protein
MRSNASIRKLEYERIEVISDPTRELIDDLWPELVHKLPPQETAGLTQA